MTNKQDIEEGSSEDVEPEDDSLGQDESIDQDEASDSDALQKALEEADKHRDTALRAEAEMQNLRRRVDRDIQNAHKFGIERLLQNLLPVVDSIEKAIETSEQAEAPAEDPQLEGIKLCQKLFIEVLVKEGIEAVDPQGEPFDPNLHQALSMVDSADLEPNSVIAVIQKGYTLHGRLVRPAMVIVSKSS
ncbi:MAG: nucleotide exchange factor GrpE [Pseudomonadales bacterium]|nr:nucleotide exchange factor GrpE [Pseudomonadales bacterium]